MKIYYDSIVWSLQNAGGISTYWGELMRRLLRDQKDVSFFEYDHLNIVRRSISTEKIQGKVTHKGKLRTYIRFLPVQIPDHAPFIFHSSYNRVTHNVNAKQVVTIHDFVHEKFYSGVRKFLHSYQKGKAIHAADRIIVVSENTKKDLLIRFPEIAPEIVEVVYNGVSQAFKKLENAEATSKRPYLLFVGSRERYKNFDFVCQMMAKLPEFDLLMVGAPIQRLEAKMLNDLLPNRWEIVSGISNLELNKLYNNASVFLYPSSYEGFGIPILEAMKAGVPFIAMNKSSIPEVAGNAGLLMDHLVVDDFIDGIRTLVQDREQYALLGYQQVQKFSWEKTYQQTLSVYDKLSR